MVKLTKLFFLLSTVLVLTSCGDDDEAANQDTLVGGTWTCIESTATINSVSTAPNFEIMSVSDVSFTNLNYDLTFSETDFTTTGGYTSNITTTVVGSSVLNQSTTLTGIMGSGTYTVDGNRMTTQGSFFDFDANGMSQSAMGDEQTIEFQIVDGLLTFSQNETMTSTESGTTTTSTIVAVSKWQKK